MKKLKVGIVGCGGIANGKHLPSIIKTNRAEVVAFCDIDETALKATAKLYGDENAKLFFDYNELVKEDLDAVYVCTPNRTHCEITVAALLAGNNVMCEKPMAINYGEAVQMKEAADKSGKLLTIGYQNRYRADSQYLKKECENGVLGDIYFAKAQAIRRRAVPTWGVFLNEFEQGGGPLIDIGTHALDLALWMMNNYNPSSVRGTVYHKLNSEVESANAFGPWDPEKFTVEDSAFAFIVMENGATIVLESSWALNTLDVQEAKTVLCGTKGGADMVDGIRMNGVHNNKQFTTVPDLNVGGVDFNEGGSVTPEVMEQNVFYDAIEKGAPLVVLPEQAMVVTRILDAVYESAKLDKEVSF